MEGDAGAGRLNPIDEDDPISSAAESADAETSETPAGSEVTDEDSADTELGATEESEVGAGAGEDSEAEVAEEVERRPSRVNRAWLATIAALSILFSGAIATGGYVALRYHQEFQAGARNAVTALQIAKDCVVATQAPDTNSMAASEQKIIDCGTDQYRTQALLYSSMLVQAYQAANVHLKVSDMRAAVERNNPDGSVDVLVALRVKVSNEQAEDQEAGYRLRVKMAPVEGTYKISKLEQVTK